ncbi:MAG: MmcQ/YjbR family DNA-binding protein [Actinomycetota bacterium]
MVTTAQALRKVRAVCLGLPETNERLSHGSPTFFIRDKKTFATFLDDHHGDGRLALWCAAPTGMQQTLIAGAPEHYFVPPYVGHRGWVGVRLDRALDWDEVAGVLEEAFLTVAPKTVLKDAGFI